MIEDLVRRALEEDIGPGDVTTQACVPDSQMATGRFIARDPLVIAGLEVLPLIYGPMAIPGKNGDQCDEGDVIATVSGTARKLLTCERVALNFLQRLSGVAT